MAVPEYRYIGVDLLTRAVIEDLPLYGTSFQRRISGPGNMTGSFKLGTGLFSDADLLNASEPGLRALFAVRNNQVVWAGPIFSRTYQSQASVCNMTGQSYESIFAKIKILSSINRPSIDQLQQFKYLIDLMQTQLNCNFGINTSGIGTSGVLRDLTVADYEHKKYSEPIDDMLKAAGSFDYVIDYYLDSNDNPQIFVKTGYPYLGYGQQGIELDYPGQVTNYYWPDSAAKGIVRETVLGKGEGTAMAVATYTNQDLVVAGYPMWEDVDSEKSISDPATLARIAEEAGRTKKMPVVVPTIDLAVAEGEDGVDFTEWSNFGVPIVVNVDEGDPRFPNGIRFGSRMLGWDYTPASSENSEELKLVLEGQD